MVFWDCPGVSYGVLGCPMESCGNQMHPSWAEMVLGRRVPEPRIPGVGPGLYYFLPAIFCGVSKNKQLDMSDHHDLPFKAEYAKSSRASCKACKGNITQDSLRLALMVQVT